MDVRALTDRHVMATYGRQPLTIVRGEGTRVWDEEGRSYLDFLGGLAVNVVGHCHPAVVQAIQDQASRLLHCSNLYYSEPGARLAEALAGRGLGDRVFFCNSGAEANEGALKLARKHFGGARNRVLALEGSFHGRTLATLAATDRPDFREGFGASPPGFGFLSFGDTAGIDETVAAVIVEPIQGEGGVREVPLDYLQALRRRCDENGALLIADEIQSGMGRTGTFLASPVQADIVTLAKGLGGGMPIGAFGARGTVAETLRPGHHGSTFGANPVCSAAALATLQVLDREGLLERAVARGALFREELRRLLPEATMRGRGLMVGVDLPFEGAGVVDAARERGLLLNCTAKTVLRFLPPLTVSEDEIREAAALTAEAVNAVGGVKA